MTFLVLRLCSIRVARTLLLAVVILLWFIQVLSLDLSAIFATVALVTRAAAVVPFRKKGRGRRHSGVMLVPRITRFLVVPMGGLCALDFRVMERVAKRESLAGYHTLCRRGVKLLRVVVFVA